MVSILFKGVKGLIFFPIFILISYSASKDGIFSNLLQLFSFVVIILPFTLFGLLAFILNALAIISYSVITTKITGDFSNITLIINTVVQVSSVFAIFFMHNLGRKKLNISFLAPISLAILLFGSFFAITLVTGTNSLANNFASFLNTIINQQSIDIINTGAQSNIDAKDLINSIVLFLPGFTLFSVTIMLTISYYLAFFVGSYLNSNISTQSYKLEKKAMYLHNSCFLGFSLLALLVNNISFLESQEVSNFKYFVYTATISYLCLYIVQGIIFAINIIKRSLIYVLATIIIVIFINIAILIPVVMLGVLYSFNIIKLPSKRN